MQGIQRKLVYIGLYQLIAISVTTFGLGMASGKESAAASSLGIAACLIAMVWNFAFNTAFELWESRQLVKGRSLRRRIAHALGFELGLVAILVPLFAYVLEISLWHSLLLDVGLIAFFLIYAFTFNWGFDRVFGLPNSSAKSSV